MLQRFFIHFSLVILFAFTQIGVATHEISHLSDFTQQNQQTKQDKQAPNHQCEQCVSHADVESALAASTSILELNQCFSASVSDTYFSFFNLPHRAYSARAPPHTA